MATLKHRNTQPPGGFSYYQKDTRYLLKGDSLGELTDRVVRHRKYRNLLPTDAETVQLEIERQICTRLGSYHCRAEGTEDEWVPIENHGPLVTLSAITGFSAAALEWIKTGHELVPIEEANRRRDICISCPLNSPVGGCKCSAFYNLVSSIVPRERQLEDLYVCHACACSLQAKANLPMNVVHESNEGRKLDFPAYCWQLEDRGEVDSS